MAYADIPLTTAMQEACDLHGPAARLYGGEESAAWRVRDRVIRISALDKDPVRIEWCHRVAAAARAGGCTEALVPLPLPGRHGATTTVIDRRVVSVWPYIDGVWAPESHTEVTRAAARLLARLHRALLPADLPARPHPCFVQVGLDGRTSYEDPRLQDPQLDTWLAEFSARSRLQHPVHGDYYHGNLLTTPTDPTHIIAVLDWDEAMIAPPEVDVASAALEFSNGFCDDIADARHFIAMYHQAGGTAEHLTDEATVQLIRHRLRRDSVHFTRATALGTPYDEHDLAYHHQRLGAFDRLRP